VYVEAGVQVCKHYAAAVVRSIMMIGLSHRLAKVRISTLHAIDALVCCPDVAKWKGAGSEAIQSLLGSRDANVVPVSAFYKHDSTTNFFAKLIVDPNVYVAHQQRLHIAHTFTLKHMQWGPTSVRAPPRQLDDVDAG
jgi:hypothetical protein